MVRLPFKDVEALKYLNLGESVHKSTRVLLQMENKVTRDNKLKLAYHDFMKECQSLDHMQEFSTLRKKSDLRNSFFLSHHGVWKASSDTTKLRIVFNASSMLPSCNISLNDLLYTGPNLLPVLADLM